MRDDLRRRSVLAAAAAGLLLVAVGEGVGGLSTPPTPAPDVVVLRGAIRTEQALIARYRMAMAGVARPGRDARPAARPAPRAPGQAHVHAHRAVQPRCHPAGLPLGLGAGRPGPPPAATLAALEADETAAASSLAGPLTLAPPALAQLLASIAASEASHALLLRMHGAARHQPTGPASAGPATTGPATTGLRPPVPPRPRVPPPRSRRRSPRERRHLRLRAGRAELGTAARDLALRDWTKHQIARDQLEAMLITLGAKPVAARPAYQLPFPARHPGRDLARGLPGEPGRGCLSGPCRARRSPAAGLGCRAGPRLRRCARQPGWAGPWLSRAARWPGDGTGPAVSLAVVPQCQFAVPVRSASPPGSSRTQPAGLPPPDSPRVARRPAACARPPAGWLPPRAIPPGTVARAPYSAAVWCGQDVCDPFRRALQLGGGRDPLGPGPPEPPAAVFAAARVDVLGQSGRRGIHHQARDPARRRHQVRGHPCLASSGANPSSWSR